MHLARGEQACFVDHQNCVAVKEIDAVTSLGKPCIGRLGFDAELAELGSDFPGLAVPSTRIRTPVPGPIRTGTEIGCDHLRQHGGLAGTGRPLNDSNRGRGGSRLGSLRLFVCEAVRTAQLQTRSASGAERRSIMQPPRDVNEVALDGDLRRGRIYRLLKCVPTEFDNGAGRDQTFGLDIDLLGASAGADEGRRHRGIEVPRLEYAFMFDQLRGPLLYVQRWRFPARTGQARGRSEGQQQSARLQ